jgi:hypothetical protein
MTPARYSFVVQGFHRWTRSDLRPAEAARARMTTQIEAHFSDHKGETMIDEVKLLRDIELAIVAATPGPDEVKPWTAATLRGYRIALNVLRGAIEDGDYRLDVPPHVARVVGFES